jgi:hypothetical protein
MGPFERRDCISSFPIARVAACLNQFADLAIALI